MFARQWETESAVAEDDVEEMVSYESTFCHLFQLFFSCDIVWARLDRNNYLAAILKAGQKRLSKICQVVYLFDFFPGFE